MTASVPSVESLGDRAGEAAERHLVPSFTALLRGSEHVRRGEGWLALITREPHPLANMAVVDTLSAAARTGQALAALPVGETPTAVVHPGVRLGPGVEALLTETGHALTETMPAMAVDVDALGDTALPPGDEFLRVGDDLRDAWSEAFAAGYEVPPGCARAFTPRDLGPKPLPDAPVQLFAVVRAGRVVCTSALVLADGLAGVYCVSTLPDHRGRGLGAHATAEPLRRARALGYRVGVLQSTTAGHGVYRKLGFRDVGAVPVHVALPGGG